MPGPRRRSGDPSRGSTLRTVAPRSASSPPANSPARLWASSTTTTPSSAPPRSEPGNPARSAAMIGSSVQPEHSRGVPVEPLLLDGVLQRQVHVLADQGLVRLTDQPRRETHEHLVLDQRVTELHQHLPAGTGLTEVFRAVRGGVHVEVRMPAHERDHLVDPGPAAQTADDPELREIHRDLVEVPRMAEIVRPIVRVVHRRIDPHGDAELRRLRVERVVAPVAGGNAVDERRDAERLEALLADQPLELADTGHTLEGVDADARQPDEAVGVAAQERRLLLVRDAERHRAHDSELAELVDVRVQAHVGAVVGAFAARAEDPAIVRHTVPGRLTRARRLVMTRLRLTRLGARNTAFHVDDSYHHGLPRSFDTRVIGASDRERRAVRPRARRGPGSACTMSGTPVLRVRVPWLSTVVAAPPECAS